MQFNFNIRLNPKIDGILNASKGLLCLASGIFGLLQNPQMLLNGIKNMASDLLASVAGAVGYVVQARINQMLGLVSSVLSRFQLIINFNPSIQMNEMGQGLEKFILDRQQCVNMTANLISCIAAGAINKISNKVAMEVDKKIAPVTEELTKDVMKVNGVIDNLVNKHNRFVNKALTQNKLLL